MVVHYFIRLSNMKINKVIIIELLVLIFIRYPRCKVQAKKGGRVRIPGLLGFQVGSVTQ